ncbi:PepSY domain-containing protein [Bacillus massiliglaciei]|uniref:PepSY domain-containing protein n=1 Tax=Bacillus massiliglaciei TaxID=1816693 RepID=UPI000AB145D3|nr:PepSY domain-containing protein [Bacillus massiliglaciei]
MKEKWMKIRNGLSKRKKGIMIGIVAFLLIFSGVTATAVYAVNKGNLKENEAVKVIGEDLNGEVTKVEKDWDYPMTYEMTVKTDQGYEDVEVDAKNGDILSRENENDEVISKDQVKISAEEAEKMAVKEIPGKVTEMDLDEENGVIVYELEVVKDRIEYDIEIDAVTGKVLKNIQD